LGQLPINKLVYASCSARLHDCAIGGTTQRTPILTRLVAPRRPIILTGVSWQQVRSRKWCRQQWSEVVPFGEKSQENEVLAPAVCFHGWRVRQPVRRGADPGRVCRP